MPSDGWPSNLPLTDEPTDAYTPRFARNDEPWVSDGAHAIQHDAGTNPWQVLLVLLLLVVAVAIPAGGYVVAQQRPRIVDPAATALSAVPSAPAAEQAASFDELLGLLANLAGPRQADSAGQQLPQADIAGLAAALVRIERGGSNQDDLVRVCAVIDCAAVGGQPGPRQVSRLFAAIDAGTVGAADIARRSDLSERQAQQLVAALASARGE